MSKYFTSAARNLYLKWLSIVIELSLSLCLALIVSLYSQAWNYCDNLTTIALVCAVASNLIVLPKAKPRWPYLMFVLGIFGFYGFNLLSVKLADPALNLGVYQSKWMHLSGLMLALAAGLGLRTRGSRARLLAVLLAATGLWYLGELATIPWRPEVWLDNRFVGSREIHTILGMELLPLFALFFACAVFLKNRKLSFASLLGAVLFGILLFLNKSRFALLTMVYVTIPTTVSLQNRFGNFRQRLAAALVWFLLIGPAVSMVWYHYAGPGRRQTTSIEYRVIAWNYVLRITEQSPWYRIIIGHGRFPRTFDTLAEYYDTGFSKLDKAPLYRGRFGHCHNVLLQTFLETGILGVAGLACIYISAFYRAAAAWSRQKRPEIVSGVTVVALVTIAVMTQMDYNLGGFYRVGGLFCWFITGLAFASGAQEDIPGHAAKELNLPE